MYVNGTLYSPNQNYEFIDKVSWIAVMAEAPKGLTGSGKVMAIGTWDLLGKGKEDGPNDNNVFVSNILNWLIGRN
jgi:hypothetical protein